MSYKLNDNVEVYTTEEADERFSAGNVQVEKERAEAAEAALDTKIDDEITRATGAEGTNASNIAQNTSAIASLSNTVSGHTTDIAANTSAITAEVARATTAEGTLSNNIINEATRATAAEQSIRADLSVVEVNRSLEAFIFSLEADKPSVNYDAATKIKISDGQLVFVKDTKKWYTATTTSTGGDPVTWTEFQMPGGSVGLTIDQINEALYLQSLQINEASYQQSVQQYIILTGTVPSTDLSDLYKNNTTAGGYPDSTFEYVYSGESISFESAFEGCTGITSVDYLDTHNSTDFTNMFKGCTALTSVCDLDTHNGITFESMFEGCTSALSLPDLDVGSGTSFTDMFKSCTSLTTLEDSVYAPIAGRWQFGDNVSFGVCPLNRESILKVFNGLKEVTGKIITISSVTDSYLSSDDKAIAISKGWTVAIQ